MKEQGRFSQTRVVHPATAKVFEKAAERARRGVSVEIIAKEGDLVGTGEALYYLEPGLVVVEVKGPDSSEKKFVRKYRRIERGLFGKNLFVTPNTRRFNKEIGSQLLAEEEESEFDNEKERFLYQKNTEFREAFLAYRKSEEVE